MSAPRSSKVASDAEHSDLPVVRTLKPPPEIWELVQPVESKRFNPRLTFLRRVGSGATRLLLMALVVGLVLGVCIAGLKFYGIQEATVVKKPKPAQVASKSRRNETVNPPSSSTSAIDTSATQPLDVIAIDNSKPTTSPASKRKVGVAVGVRKPYTKAETTKDVGANPATPPAPSQARASAEPSTAIADSNKKSSSDQALAKPSNTSLSRQVIAPLKPDSARKAKVIQWP